MFWQHIKSRAIINEQFTYESIFTSNSDIHGLVMSSSPNIQLIFYKIQVIGRMDSPYYIFHSFVHNVLGYISLIQHFL
jgi:hypothetical protein